MFGVSNYFNLRKDSMSRDRYYIIKDLVINFKEWNSAMDLLASCPSRSLDIAAKGLNAYSYEERELIKRLDRYNHLDKVLKEELNGAK